MIGAVHGIAIDPAAGAEAPGVALRRFAAGVRWRHVRGRALGALLRTLLALAVPAVLVAWWLPSRRVEVLAVVLLTLLPLVAIAAARAWWQGRHILHGLGRSIAGDGRELAAVRDELATWLELADRGAVEGAMFGWLERDVSERLQPHAAQALTAIARPRLGRFRWLIPLVILLLVLWFLSEWLAPPWLGALGGRATQPTAGQGENGGGSGADGGAGDEQAPAGPEQGPPEQARPESPPQPEPRDPEPSAPEPVPPEPPAPLLDLPDQQRFVVPDFIGDGPTRRARVRAAELDQATGSANPRTTPSPLPGGPESAPPPPNDITFERAAEAAQRARHVPPSERAMVRRYFERLQQVGK